MTDIKQAARVHARQPHREAAWAWRHAARRAWCVRPAKDHGAALAVLREAIAQGSTISTPAILRPHVTNPADRRGAGALPKDLVIVTKIGVRPRRAGSGWPAFQGRADPAVTTICAIRLRGDGRVQFAHHVRHQCSARESIEAPLTVLAESSARALSGISG